MKGDKTTLTQEVFDDCLSIKDAENYVYTLLPNGKVAIRTLVTIDNLDDLLLKKSPKVTHVVTNAAGSENSHTFLKDTKSFILRCNNASRITVYWESGAPADERYTLGLGEVYRESLCLLPENFTIYFSIDSANRTVQILEWT